METANNEQSFCIKAEDRFTKKRVIIRSGMTKKEAEAWKPERHTKKAYRYFRVVKSPNK